MATPERFAIESLFRIVNKDQVEVDFKLNAAQETVDNNFSRRIIIPKARQEGVSKYFLARSAIKCMGVKNTKAVVISHDGESTERMLNGVRYYLETMKGPKPIIKTNSKNEISFPKTNSVFYIGTAGSRSFGRGDTITDLHCSEVPYWPDPKRLMTGLLQAVPKVSGSISIESTGRGSGDWFHSLCMRAAKGQSSFKLVFLPWQNFPEYKVPMTQEEQNEFMLHLREDLDEPQLVKSYGMSAERLAWRRIVLEDECDNDLYEWNKEYPSCLDDCFQAAGGGIFRVVNYVESPDWIQVDSAFAKLNNHPQADKHYIIGGDVGAGVGKDASVAEVFCLETGEQVAEYINNKIEPDIFGIKLAELGRIFNEAFIGCESNNHGILTLKTLAEYDHSTADFRYPSNKIYRTPAGASKAPKDAVNLVTRLGVRTTSRSKPFIIGTLRTKLAQGMVIHSVILKNELSTFVELEDGSMGATTGCHDDTVMASAMAAYVESKGALSLTEAPITQQEIKDAFSLDEIIKEMTYGRSNRTFPKYLTEGI
jgi:hypothetical protein